MWYIDKKWNFWRCGKVYWNERALGCQIFDRNCFKKLNCSDLNSIWQNRKANQYITWQFNFHSLISQPPSQIQISRYTRNRHNYCLVISPCQVRYFKSWYLGKIAEYQHIRMNGWIMKLCSLKIKKRQSHFCPFLFDRYAEMLYKHPPKWKYQHIFNLQLPWVFHSKGEYPSICCGESSFLTGMIIACGTLPLGGTPVLQTGSFINKFIKIPDYPDFIYLKTILWYIYFHVEFELSESRLLKFENQRMIQLTMKGV